MGTADVNSEIEQIQQSIHHESSIVRRSTIFDSKYRTIVWLAFFIAFFNQWSGINFILYYAPEILERAGLASQESLLNSIAIGGTNIIFTFVGFDLIAPL